MKIINLTAALVVVLPGLISSLPVGKKPLNDRVMARREVFYLPIHWRVAGESVVVSGEEFSFPFYVALGYWFYGCLGGRDRFSIRLEEAVALQEEP